MSRDNDLEADITRVIEALSERNGGYALGPDVVERTVRDCFAEHRDARVKDFVGLFAERTAREQLRRLSQEAYQGNRDVG